MDRRELLQTGAALSLAAFSGAATSAEKPMSGMGHHHHMAGYGSLAHAATHCVILGEACIGHCLELLGEGRKEMAECAKSVEQMMAACNALRQLATWNSAYVPRMARVVLDMCRECEQICRKHEQEHTVCRDCAESCAACAKECAAVAV